MNPLWMHPVVWHSTNSSSMPSASSAAEPGSGVVNYAYPNKTHPKKTLPSNIAGVAPAEPLRIDPTELLRNVA